MKLIQLNLWQGRLLKQALEFLQQEKPDLLCLQEVYSSDIESPLFEFLRGYEVVQAAFPDYHAYFSPAHDMAMVGSTFAMGNAIFSRYPLTDKETFFISGEYRSYQTLDDYLPNARNLQRVMVHPEDSPAFCLVNHHGYWEPNRTGSEITVQKMQRVADIIKDSPRPLILSGDLNIVAESPAMASIQAQLRDLPQEYHLETTLSSLGKVPNVACDHICVSDRITVESFGKGEPLVSDHEPLIMTFTIPA